jgi:hypothetical protein
MFDEPQERVDAGRWVTSYRFYNLNGWNAVNFHYLFNFIPLGFTLSNGTRLEESMPCSTSVQKLSQE